jgi:hypothetical protein
MEGWSLLSKDPLKIPKKAHKIYNFKTQGTSVPCGLPCHVSTSVPCKHMSTPSWLSSWRSLYSPHNCTPRSVCLRPCHHKYCRNASTRLTGGSEGMTRSGVATPICKMSWHTVTIILKPRGQIYSQEPTSLQTHNFLIPNWEGAFFKEFLVTSKLVKSL